MVTLKQVECPDCGQCFSPRGLSGHRRLRHGVQPAPPLPKEVPRSDATPAILNALTALQDAVERIELYLATHGVPAGEETPVEELARLGRELHHLLQHIARLKQTGLAATTIRNPTSESEKRATLELARLRRDQARIVFRMEELRNGTPSDERYLS